MRFWLDPKPRKGQDLQVFFLYLSYHLSTVVDFRTSSQLTTLTKALVLSKFKILECRPVNAPH
jgi:hypothetical protein